MKKDRNDVEKYLYECVARYITDRKENARMVTVLYEKYNVPFSRSKMFLNSTVSATELNNAELYWFLDCVGPSQLVKLDTIFTDIEINSFSRLKFQEKKLEFPLVIPATKVNDNQWIGTISAQDLVHWRNQSFIIYDPEMQRRLKMIVYGGKTYEVLMPKSKKVRELMELFKTRKYIPDTIMLNLYDDADYYYDEEKRNLVINSAEHLALADGCSRTIALTKVLDSDPAFDYTMELRITAYSSDKIRQFFNQLEQHTPMPTEDIRAYKMDDAANKVTTKVNDSSSCNIAGSITHGKSNVDFTVFSDMLRICFADELSSQEDGRMFLIKGSQDIVQTINAITEGDSDIAFRKLTNREIRVMIYCAKQYYQKDKRNAYKMFKALCDAPLSTEHEKAIQDIRAKPKKVMQILDDTRKEVAQDV